MKRIIWVILFTFVIVNIVGFTVFLKGNNPQPNTNQNSTQVKINSINSARISLTELSSHNSREDCWVAYEGKVYDITAWLPEHPGSAEAILPYCGESSEFEAAFEGQHGRTQVEKLTQEGVYRGELQ